MKSKILFVDDDVRVLTSFERVVYPFRDEWDCQFESDSTQVIETLKKGSFDIVVTDVKMPKVDGLKLLALIKEEPDLRDIEVIVVTGFSDSSYKKRALDAGATDLLNKPIANEELIARIRSAVKVKGYRDELIIRNQELQDQLVSIQKMEVIGVLAGGAVHDLNSILGIIQGYGNLIMTKDVQVAGSGDDFRVIMESVDRAIAITRQIHSFSDISSHTNRTVFVGHLLEQIQTSLSATIGKRVEFELSNDCACIVDAPEGSVYQVFMNLSINAIQAMKGEGVLSIAVENIKECGVVEVSFEDTGGGIEEDLLDQIFEPLFSTKRESGGSGLGLSIVKRIMEQLGGSIDVSNGRSGAKFTLSFPVLE